MAADDAEALTRVYITQNPLVLGRIVEVMATIDGDQVRYEEAGGFYSHWGEGRLWHRSQRAARNYATELQIARLRELREEIERLERIDFGSLR